MFEADQSGIKFGPFWIKPGLTRLNVGAVMFGSFSTVAMIVVMSLMQPYILTEIVKIPLAEQGTVTGRLHMLQELVTILLVGFMGAWSDRVGRRFVYVLGFTILGAGYFIYPLATSEIELVIYRLVFAVGVAMTPVMLSTTIQDIPQEVSRGKWLGINNVLQGLGVVLISTAILSQAPGWFMAIGFDAVMAGQLTFFCAAVFCIFSALVLRASLAKSIPGGKQHESVFAGLRHGINRGRQNPRLALAFGAAFIGRGDLVVVGSFLTLWVTQAGIDHGMTTADAVGRAGMMFGIVQISAMLWAYFMGMLADRINRVTGLCIALTMAAIGYAAMGLFADPFDGSMFVLAVLLGAGEVSVIVTAGSLLGQEAGWKKRGAVVGVFNLMGGIGIMTVGYFGGIIFDDIGRAAPFVVMGILNGLLLIAGLVVRFRSGEPIAEET
jgi:MFS family permease